MCIPRAACTCAGCYEHAHFQPVTVCALNRLHMWTRECRQFMYAVKQISSLCGCRIINLLARVHAIQSPRKMVWKSDPPTMCANTCTPFARLLKLMSSSYGYIVNCKILECVTNICYLTAGTCYCQHDHADWLSLLIPIICEFLFSFFFFQFSAFTENSKY